MDKIFSNSLVDKRESELFEACKAGDIEKIRRVVANGVNPTKVVYNHYFDEVPLHWACR